MDVILFDWDGTIMDSLDAVHRANVTVLADYGIVLDRAMYRRAYQADWREMYRTLGVPPADLETVGRRWVETYGMGDGSRAFPGVVGAIRALDRAGIRMGVVTAGDSAVVTAQVEALGLAGILAVRIHGNDLPISKPDPRVLRRALEMLGHEGSAAGVWYVGDAADDMRMARAAGARGAGIRSFVSDRATLLAAGAEQVHDSVVGFVEAYLATPGPGGAR